MTLSELIQLAQSDAASSNPRRRKAGEWAAKAVDAMKKKDWDGATIAVAHAIVLQPKTYVGAFKIIEHVRIGSIGGLVGGLVKNEKRAAASRANGKKGGRPRKYPQGWRNVPRPSTRKPGETRGRKPKNPPAETGAE